MEYLRLVRVITAVSTMLAFSLRFWDFSSNFGILSFLLYQKVNIQLYPWYYNVIIYTIILLDSSKLVYIKKLLYDSLLPLLLEPGMFSIHDSFLNLILLFH